MRVARVSLQILGGIFAWMWIGASIGAMYFLYVALAQEGPWKYLLWSIVAGIVAKIFTVIINKHQRRLKYVNQLRKRGYSESEAVAAWHTAASGGFNALLNLQQADTCCQTELEKITSIESS